MADIRILYFTVSRMSAIWETGLFRKVNDRFTIYKFILHLLY